MRALEPLPLAGRKGFVIGIANDQSIAWGCARAFRAAGADLALTYLNDKALPHVAPLARHPGQDVLEARALEITSACRISLAERARALGGG